MDETIMDVKAVDGTSPPEDLHQVSISSTFYEQLLGK
jgi:hypothetical protein